MTHATYVLVLHCNCSFWWNHTRIFENSTLTFVMQIDIIVFQFLAESGYHMSKVSITELHNRYLYLPLYMYSPIQLLWVQSYSNFERIFEIFKFAFLGLDVLKQSNLRNFLSISAESGYFWLSHVCRKCEIQST